MKKNSILRHNQVRHKCHVCKKIRYETFMIKINNWDIEKRVSSYFGNNRKLWACRRHFNK